MAVHLFSILAIFTIGKNLFSNKPPPLKKGVGSRSEPGGFFQPPRLISLPSVLHYLIFQNTARINNARLQHSPKIIFKRAAYWHDRCRAVVLEIGVSQTIMRHSILSAKIRLKMLNQLTILRKAVICDRKKYFCT